MLPQSSGEREFVQDNQDPDYAPLTKFNVMYFHLVFRHNPSGPGTGLSPKLTLPSPFYGKSQEITFRTKSL